MILLVSTLSQDTQNSVNLQNTEWVEMHDGRYLSMNVPVPHSIHSYLEVFHNLFGFYYLQVYPNKMCSFFNYFLMEMTKSLTVQGIVTLDHRMRQDFAMHPEWNWAQHRPKTSHTINKVTMDDNLKVKPSTSTYRPTPQSQHPASRKQTKGKGKAGGYGGKAKKSKERNEQ